MLLYPMWLHVSVFMIVPVRYKVTISWTRLHTALLLEGQSRKLAPTTPGSNSKLLSDQNSTRVKAEAAVGTHLEGLPHLHAARVTGQAR